MFVKVKRPWTRLPANPRIDWSNSITDKLSFACYLPIAKNLVNNRSASTIQPVNTSILGRGMETVDGTGTEEIIFPARGDAAGDINVTTDYTILWIGKKTGTDGSFSAPLTMRNGFVLEWQWFENGGNLNFDNDSTTNTSTIGIGTVGNIVYYGVSSNPGEGFHHYLKDGIRGEFKTDTDPAQTITTAPRSGIPAEFTFGQLITGTAGNNLFAVHHAALIWKRKLRIIEVESVFDNIFSLLVPRTVSIHIPAAAVGGRIMSSLARHGGLAGYGGIAGQGGGLAK